MGKHSSGGFLGSGEGSPDPGRRRRPDAQRTRVPAGSAPSVGGDAPAQPQSSRRAGVESAPARLRAERDRRRNQARRIILSIVGVIIVVLLAGGIGLYAYAQKLQQTMTVVNKEQLLPVLEKVQPGAPYNLLLLGADFRKGDTQYRTDTIIVARIDPQAKKIWMLSIPRDTRVLIPGHGYQKINAAHFFGGPKQTVQTVSEYTGLPIDHYMEVNFSGFENAVNQMGGIWVNVPTAIYDKQAAAFSVKQRAARIPAGYQKLDGEHALTFVRARHQFASQDFARMSDQQIFFKALADQLAHRTDIPTMIKVVNSITPYIQTDLSLMDMMKTAITMKGAGAGSIYTATVPGTWISPFQITDDAKLAILVDNFRNAEPFNKAANASTVAQPTASPAASGTVVPAKVKITIKNGWTVVGVGSKAGKILKDKGFTVKTIGNAKKQNYKQTLIIYKTNEAAARAVATALMPGAHVVQNNGAYSSPTEILIIIGKDYQPTTSTAVQTQ